MIFKHFDWERACSQFPTIPQPPRHTLPPGKYSPPPNAEQPFYLSSVYFWGFFSILYIQLFISYQNNQIDDVQITRIFTYPQQKLSPRFLSATNPQNRIKLLFSSQAVCFKSLFLLKKVERERNYDGIQSPIDLLFLQISIHKQNSFILLLIPQILDFWESFNLTC